VDEVKEAGAVNHLGIQVNSTYDVVQAKQRLQAAGLITFEEIGIDCCCALQDKVWVTDPNVYRWEFLSSKRWTQNPSCSSNWALMLSEAAVESLGCALTLSEQLPAVIIFKRVGWICLAP
jgi:hypothetical protein